jgi:DNA-binding NtrC family response regulator
MVTDIDMPGTMDGFGLVERVREAASGLKIIMVSGNAAGMAAGEKGVPFFRKPYDFESLTLLIDTLIRPKAAEPP